MSQMYASPPLKEDKERKERCIGGKIHVKTAMKILITIGFLIILAVGVALFFKFKKALFVLLIPGSIPILTIIAMISLRPRLIWPIIAISYFHMMLASYITLIFLFYFFFKPFYIIMVLNWAFDTLHNDKTPSYYAECGVIFVTLCLFFLFNLWQALVSHAYYRMLVRNARSTLQGHHQSTPTVLIVNNKPMDYIAY